MNAFKRLSIEYEGINRTIKDYTSDSNICNYLKVLEQAVRNGEYETIKYCLDEIYAWYEKNIQKIASNNFVFNLDSHKKNMELIKQILSQLTVEDCKPMQQTLAIPKDNQDPLIFISHKSDDKKYGDALRAFIVGLGVKDSQLIYTSHPLNKIPMDANIYDYLRQHINSNIFMIILWSNSYLDSPACLNEMGAAWVVQADYTNIYVPSFAFDNPKYHQCAVDTRKMGAILNGDSQCKASMIELKEKIQSLFHLKEDEQRTNYLLDEFIKAVTEE